MVSDFEKDIFISYAHIDDEALIEGEQCHRLVGETMISKFPSHLYF